MKAVNTTLINLYWGIGEDIYNQLIQENEAKRQQDEGQMTSGRIHM